jgi:hypothetical protein
MFIGGFWVADMRVGIVRFFGIKLFGISDDGSGCTAGHGKYGANVDIG